MKTWTRVSVEQRCGNCGRAIAAGTPHLVITTPAQSWRLRRCDACAGEPVPATVPPIETDDQDARPVMTRVVPVDWKTRQSGDAA